MLLFASGIVLLSHLLLGQNVNGQDSLAKAREIFVQFWNNALATTAKDAPQRKVVRNDAAELPKRLESPLTQGILDYLNGTQQPSTNVLKERLARALTAPMMGNELADGVADVVSTKDHDGFFVVYGVDYCISCAKTWLGDFRRHEGKFVLQSSVDNPASDQTVHATLVTCSTPQPLVLLYGTHLGDAHSRLDVRALSADGELRPLWSKTDLPEGEIVIDSNGCTAKLTYLSALTSPWNQITAIYSINARELRLLHLSSQPD